MSINRHKITIDGKDFDTDTLSDEVKGNLAATQFTDAEIQCLQAKLAGIKTTRMAYVRVVEQGLNNAASPAPVSPPQISLSGDTFSLIDLFMPLRFVLTSFYSFYHLAGLIGFLNKKSASLTQKC